MKIVLLILLLLATTLLLAQPTFNKRFSFGCGQNVISSLEVTDSCYYVAGWARDSSLGCQVALLWAKIDATGNVLSYTLYGDSSEITESWQPTLQTDTDGNLVASGEVVTTTGEYALLIKWDTEGTLIREQKHLNLHSLVDSTTRTDAFAVAADSGYLHVGATYYGWQVTYFNQDWTVRWSDHTDCQGNFCFEHSILQETDGFVVGYYNGDANQRWRDYTILCVLKKYDYAGHLLWQWQNDSSEQLYGANHLIKTKDNGYVIGSSKGKEVLNSDGTTTPLQDCLIFKLDSNRNMLWQCPLRAHGPSLYAQVSRLIELPDSTIMAFSTTVDTFWSTTENRWRNQDNFLVAQLSKDGDSLWANRYYYFHEQPYSDHYIIDVERTPDGGYLCAGQAQGTDGQGSAYQQGWLLKLDSMGCLIPGCRSVITNTTVVSATPEATLSVYPNPTTDYLNVLYRNQQVGGMFPASGERLTWRILDAQGRVLRQHHSRAQSDQTYIFEVSSLLAGWYVLEVVQGGLSRGGEQVSVERVVFVKN